MLYGRTREAAEIERLLGAAREGRGSAVLLRGEAGIGKSALLEHAHESATGFTVLSARGVEAESELPFAALADLVRPALGAVDALPARQAAAIRGALALGPPVESDRYAVAAATLGLLASAAESAPVLVIVDDSHWIDAASREALLFAARRLESDPVLVVFAIREGEGESYDETGLQEMLVGPLDDEAAADIVDEVTAGEADATVRRELVGATGGNPLALVEVAGSLTAAQLHGHEPLGEALPVAASVERAFLRRTAALSDGARAALLVAAVGASDHIAEIEAACTIAGADPEGLREAEGAGLLARDRRIEFRHPLLRSAVYHAASLEQRRRAHGALARALAADVATERRAWHLAAAAEGVDEAAAQALTDTAAAARERGALGAAARALERAAELTAEPDTRVRMRFDAASNLYLSGGSAHARRLLDAAVADCTDPLLRADIDHLYGQLETWGGQPRPGHKRLAAAAVEIEHDDPRRAAMMLADASLAALLSGEIPVGIELARRGHGLADEAGRDIAAVTGPVLANGLLLSGDQTGVRELLLAWKDIPVEERSPFTLIQVPPPLTWIEEYGEVRAVLDALLQVGRDMSSPSMLVPALFNLAELDFRLGRWDQAYASITEALSLGRDTGQALHLTLAFAARIEGPRGHDEECRAHALEALELGRQLEYGAAIAYSLGALGQLELGRGNTDAAIGWLEELRGGLQGMGVREPAVVQEPPDLIEAYVLAGRTDDAREALDSFSLLAEASGFAWSRAAAARCAGLLADGESYRDHFEHAVELHARAQQPFATARTLLCYGERLRRDRRVADAREQLRAALAEFERLGAEPWSARAVAELRATGEHRRSRGPETAELTPRELQVALLVAQGATNREAAASLFLTVKTIEFHLGHIYRKLDVRSRTELARRLATAESEPVPL